QNPATSSFVSAKGPSITVFFPFENRTRAPFELDWSPSPASITPAFTSCSLNLPISARIFWSGRTPASESLFAFTITMNRIVASLVDSRASGRPPTGVGPWLYFHVERRSTGSTRRSRLGSAVPQPHRPRPKNPLISPEDEWHPSCLSHDRGQPASRPSGPLARACLHRGGGARARDRSGRKHGGVQRAPQRGAAPARAAASRRADPPVRAAGRDRGALAVFRS